MANQRKMQHAIVDSKAQLRMLAPYLFLLIASILEILILNYQLVSLVGSSIALGDPRAMTVYNMILSRVQIWSGVAMLFSGLLAVGLWIIYTHRVQGAAFAIQQHLKKILARDYDGKIQLRAHDELKEIAETLNRITEQLRKEKSERSTENVDG